MPKYHVTYSVTRAETYVIEAKDEDEAEDLAFQEGEELSNSGDTTDVTPIETTLEEAANATA